MINLPRCGPDYVFDGPNSFLRFMVTTLDAATINLDHSCDCFSQKIEVLHGGNVLEVIDNYHQRSHLLLDSQVDLSLRNTALSLTKGCNLTYGEIRGGTIATPGTQYFTPTLLSGIVGSLARNYIPVNELQGSIQIRLLVHHK